MKKILVYVSICVFALLAVFFIKYNQKVIPPKLYTVYTYYSYTLDDETIDIFFYLNKEHPLIDEQSYDHISIENSDQSKKVALTLNDIKYVYDEVYLGETYQKYVWIFEMPHMSQHFIIDDALLNITLLNGNNYQFNIGTISLYKFDESENDALNWRSLEASKKENGLISRMHQIYISYDDLSKTIENIELGVNDLVDYQIDHNQITITIDDEHQLFYATPIIINYLDGTSQKIDYFIYINDYYILKESGYLLYGYAIS